jgi:hypothetical protein
MDKLVQDVWGIGFRGGGNREVGIRCKDWRVRSYPLEYSRQLLYLSSLKWRVL